MSNSEFNLSKYNPNTEFLLYKTPNGDVKIDVLIQNETIWMPQKKIAQLFGVQRPEVTKHLKNIFESGELNEKVVCSILELPTQHGAIKGKEQKVKTKFYNLDAIIAIGYRVNSKRATQFRIWNSTPSLQATKKNILAPFRLSKNKTTTSLASLRLSESKTKTALASLRLSENKTKTSLASLRLSENKTKTSLASLRLSENKTKTSLASLRLSENKTKTSLASLRLSENKTKTSLASLRLSESMIEFKMFGV